MLTISKVSKSFPGVKALSNVQLEVKAGEIHALVGENGAGKSTLTRIIAGVHKPDEGTIEFDGEIVHWDSPAAAKAAGIHVIYQEFVLFPNLTVAENIFLGHERRGFLNGIDHGRTRQDALDLLNRLGVSIDPDALVSELSVADQQMVEIAKALVHKVKLLILDEPTAVIAGHEVELLFGRLRALRDDGVAIIYISHRLEEIFDLCDRVTVFKDGQFVATETLAEMTNDRLVSLMVGRDMSELFPPKSSAPGPVVLTATNISVKGRVHSASLELRAGEITALSGMVGAGRTELAMAIFGGLPMIGGQVAIGGETFTRMTPSLAIEKGIGLLTEDRKGQGLAMLTDVATNISASDLGSVSHKGWLNHGREKEIAVSEIANYRIACRGPQGAVLTMSGGNQQKVLVARWARTSKKVIIMDEPTRGVDVGAKAEIYRIMRDLADRGLAVLMISSEMPEVIGLADRVYVMREGVITAELRGDEIAENRIIQAATQKRAS
ncbi:sugar ABC transporter ATP-binding protein [Stagnihabitans tardus]|uniref:ATP-binding cassette domain-containing protein n=1 Tax=Stagnihabitans tardus TaxID=2699202 RepID=A0AAE5BXP8_9RHOB|nr:sugar ABC transporter ATP-binding protein [Stagnihabitans tardus]NBZ89583.1 ATP-binding cassette domain-containing protein [Stagnihabitans tardus]